MPARSAYSSSIRDPEQPKKDERWAEQQYDMAYECYFDGNWHQAEKHLKEALAVSADDPRYRLLLAQVYSARGWLSMALSELTLLKRQDPKNAGAKSLEALLNTKIRDRDCELEKQASHSGIWRAFLQRAGMRSR